MEWLFNILMFLVAIFILVSVHEFGHFWVARKAGVRVLKFSIGFGKSILRFQKSPDDTEYVVGTIPLGGYVKMLGESEEDVTEAQKQYAFNYKPVHKRIAIVAAGPVFNLLLAVLVYWIVLYTGTMSIRPLIGEVEPQSIADQAGFGRGEEFVQINDKPVIGIEGVAERLMSASIDGQQVRVHVKSESGQEILRTLDFSNDRQLIEKPRDVFSTLGITLWSPSGPPQVTHLEPGDPAQVAGLEVGDWVERIDDVAIESRDQMIEIIQQNASVALVFTIRRDDANFTTTIVPKEYETPEGVIGRIGAGLGYPPEWYDRMRVEVQLPAGEALVEAFRRTWDMSVLLLKMLGEMLVGNASIEHISGPITIAEVAGKSAQIGFDRFMDILALLSISLGVLNLLPIPILDGGHLLYYCIELVKGSPLSEEAMAFGQRIGLAIILMLMTVAFYNDIARLLAS